MARFAHLTLLTLALAGCSSSNWQGPQAMFGSPVGVQGIYPYSGTVSGAPLPAAGSTVLPTAPAQDGTYAGQAVPLSTDGGQCWQARAVGGFQVHGGTVRYGGFNGQIDANNSVQMVYGTKWLIGRFSGDLFQGQLITSGAQQNNGCTFALTLRRMGA